jgi:membrane associated rhomboid family serine protease
MDTRRMCPNCRAFITSKDRVCPYCDEKVGPRAIDVRKPGQIMGGLIPNAGYITAMILLLNFGFYIATVIYSRGLGNDSAFMNLDPETLFRFGAKYGRNPAQFGWWRLVTAGFLHGGLFHILMNSWVLYDLGAQVEEFYGGARFIVIYFIATVGGFWASSYWSAGLSIGASAGLFGLIGAMIAFGMRSSSAIGAAVRGLYIRWAIYGLLFGLLPMFRIDNAAHIGGLTTGFACAYLAGTPKLTETGGEQFWRIGAWASVIVTVLCFVRMYMTFSQPLR